MYFLKEVADGGARKNIVEVSTWKTENIAEKMTMVHLDRSRRSAGTTYSHYCGFQPFTKVRDLGGKKDFLQDTILNVDPAYHSSVREDDVTTHVSIGTHVNVNRMRRTEESTWSIYHIEFSFRVGEGWHLNGDNWMQNRWDTLPNFNWHHLKNKRHFTN